MTETDLKAIIKDTLHVPVYDDGFSITYPSATYSFYMDSPELFGDGHAAGRVASVQIDLWYKNKEDRDTAADLLATALDEADCTSPTINRIFDATARKFRATFQFETRRI